MWYNSFGKVVIVIVLSIILLAVVAFSLSVFVQYRALDTTNQNSNTATTPVINYLTPDADDDPVLGKTTARVEIITFEDFQCPFCKEAEPILYAIYQRYPNDIRIVFRDFPLYTIHDQAIAAAQAGECADEQGKFWVWHDLAFINQADLPDAPAVFSDWAEQAGMDVADFATCVEVERYKSEVQKDLNEGFLAGVAVTPTFFVNGQKFEGVLSEEQWIEIIEAAILAS